MDEAGYRVMFAERKARPQLLPETIFRFVEPLSFVGRTDLDTESAEDVDTRAPALHLTWFAALAAFGVLMLFVRGQWREAALLLLPCAVYVGLIYSVGDAMARYLLAVEWLGILYAMLGVDGLLWLVTGGWRKAALVEENSSPVEAAA